MWSRNSPARSPLTAFDREHLVLLILDGSSGRIHEVISEKVMPRSIFRWRKSRTIAEPPTLWSGLLSASGRCLRGG